MTAALLRRNRQRTARLGIAGILALLCIAAVPALAAAQAGTVLTLRGDCVATTGSDKRALADGGPVYVGDLVETGGEARLKLRMIDGSIVAVASASTLTVTDYSSGPDGQNRSATLTLASGLIHAVVSKAAAPAHFEVDSAAGVAAVRGTDWFMRILPDGVTQVGVLTGLVNLKSGGTSHAVDIPAHWGAKLAPGKDPGQPRRWQDTEFAEVSSLTEIK